MAVTYLRLYDPTTQFQLKNGAINVAGLLKVKYEGTDDYAPVFDEDGTQLAQPVILDNNGRSQGLFVDASRVYWLEVDDRDGYELFTIRKMSPCGGGGGSALGTKYGVVSSDGTVSVESYDDGGITYFDLSTAVTSEASTWGATFATANAVSGDDNWEIIPVVTSAGTSQWNNGWTAKKDCVADIAASLEMAGDSAAVSTVDVMCTFTVDGVGVSTEYSQLDPSDSRGKVSFEYKGDLLEGQVVDCRIFVKSVESMSPSLVAKVYFNEECDGIIGGGGGGNYTAGDYVEITSADVINVTGVQPQSGMSSYVQQSAFSSMSSVVSSIQDDTAYISSVVSGITGDFSGYIPYAALSGDGVKITGISGSAIGGTDYSAGEYVKITGDTISVTGLQPVSGMSSYVEKSAFDECCSSMSGYISSIQGDTAYISSVVSGKLENSASSLWYPLTGNPSGFLTEHQELTGYVEKSAISAQSSQWNEVSGLSSKADASSLTGKLDNSASSLWYPLTGNPSGFLTEHQDLSGYVQVSAISAESSMWNSASAISAVIPWSALEGTGSTITAISGSAVGSTSEGKVYSGIDPVVVDNAADTISVRHSGLTVDETMTAYASGADIVIGVKPGSFVEPSAMTAYQPSGDYAYNSALTAYQPSGDYVDRSSISAESSVWNSASAISAVIPWSALSGDGTSITGISGSAIGGATGDYVEKSSRDVAIGNSNVVSGTDTFAQGYHNSARSDSFAQGDRNSAIVGSFAQGDHNSAIADSFAQGFYNLASSDSFAQGYYNSASSYSFAQGYGNSAKNTAAVFGQYNRRGNGDTSVVGDSAAFAIGDGTARTARHDLMLVTKDGEITMYSSTADTTGTGIMSSIRAISASASGAVDSAYVEAAVSGKQDASSMNAYQLTAGMSAYQPSGDYAYNSSLAGYIPTSESSKYVTSLAGYATEEYVDSAVSGISGNYVEKSAMAVTIGDSNSASFTSLAHGYGNSATNNSIAQGYLNSADTDSIAQGTRNYAYQDSLAHGVDNSANRYSVSMGKSNDAYNNSVAAGSANRASGFSQAFGLGTVASASGLAIGTYNLAMDAAFAIGDGTGSGSRHDLARVTRDGEITMYSSTADTVGLGLVSSIKVISAAAAAGVDSATVSAIASSYSESAASSKLDTTAFNSSEFYTTANESGFITVVDLSPYQEKSGMTAYQPYGDYAYNSSLSGYIPTSESGDYQQVSGMTAYQPSGDYIYASSLGILEI